MAIPLAIDTNGLLEQFSFIEEVVLGQYGGGRGRFQIHRVCVYTTIAHDSSTFTPPSTAVRLEPVRQVQQAALDWQADQEDDLDEMEVFHHLKQLAATTSSIAGASHADDHTNATTTLLASAQCPTFAARAQGRPPSSFHRYSLRTSMFHNYSKEPHGRYFRIIHTDMSTIAYKYPLKLFWFRHPIVWASRTKVIPSFMVWHLQVDFVDLFSWTPHPTWRPGKRRRRALNPFLQVSNPGGGEDTSQVNYLPEAKRFKGVRYRSDRRTWVAEMKPPKRKNKVSFGDFKSQTEAARAVDAAFYHYGKIHLLNFADTPQILSTLPTSAELNEEDKLNLVKEQAKRLASMASVLPSTPISPSTTTTDAIASVNPFELPESSRGLTASHTRNIPSPVLLSFEEADDGISRSSVHFTDALNCLVFSGGVLMNVVNSPGVEHPSEFQEMSRLDFLVLSPPVPMFQVDSPCDLQSDIADRLMEQQSFTCEELLRLM